MIDTSEMDGDSADFQCESCGSDLYEDMVHFDDDGIALCRACWEDLVRETRRAILRRKFKPISGTEEKPWKQYAETVNTSVFR